MYYCEPSEFEDAVKQFNAAFNSHPLSRNQMESHLRQLISEDENDICSQALVDFVMSLQKVARFGLRLGLIVEELGEYAEAFLKNKPVEEQAKESADIEYVLHGMNDVMGYDANAARGQVAYKNHQKILNKDKMKIGEGGKIIKPEDQ